ncbi:exodeoxyribonuclease VII large subunit [Tahibacter amnicola]|uniref:Exodeoxyribonuclease 7 large subunit n=1 Tax=Tahibacter amnicola TaxID=2976241 RepID=A0ABY6BDH9_9GAMM|nr:exodeoxyribonuclease VII large subunit [Tahibacter amnicola]UXI66671.1 exodeoxyribonuclease VII large subunit [Tahibacter amnicola]
MTEDRLDYVAERDVLTPSLLTRRARDLLERGFGLVWLEGEISNLSRPSSGHLYFSLKDSGAQVRCAMFKPKSTWLKFRPVDGLHVVARARVSLYEARGEFQLIVESLEEAGEGALQREFERLKALLAAEGLFDTARKRRLPDVVRHIAVVTSPSGAAVRDVLSVLGRRYPLAQVDIIPVPVQGKEAPPAIVAALAALSRRAIHDVVLVTRGGGSIEDLWAFNDEMVARAISQCRIPVVSAIGHEVDFTIADFVADLRAPTPSAAAELLVPDIQEISRSLRERFERLGKALLRLRQDLAQRIDRLFSRLETRSPQARLALGRSRLDGLRRRMDHALVQQRHHLARELAALSTRLGRQHPQLRLARDSTRARDGFELMRRTLETQLVRQRARLTELGRTLHAVSPLATLGRGYAILLDGADGHVLRSVGDVRAAPTVTARLHDGAVTLRVDGLAP